MHVALGSNVEVGGEVDALVHCDMVCMRFQITIDGKQVFAGGKIALAESNWREDHQALPMPDSWRPHTAIVAIVNENGELERIWDTGSGRRYAATAPRQESPDGDSGTRLKLPT